MPACPTCGETTRHELPAHRPSSFGQSSDRDEGDTRCILGFGVVWSRDWGALQQVIDNAPPAHRYFSDGFPTYAQLFYPGIHAVALFVYAWNKRQRFEQTFPKLPAHVCDFVTDLI